MSTEFDLTNVSRLSKACSPESGWITYRLSISTPSFLAYAASRACSASINTAVPPCCWQDAIACKAKVVLPEDSGP